MCLLEAHGSTNWCLAGAGEKGEEGGSSETQPLVLTTDRWRGRGSSEMGEKGEGAFV